MTVEIGHNGGPTFDEIVRENQDRGLLLSMKEVIVEAVRDPRLDRRHLRVLAEVIDHINSSTGTAYPGHKTIAASLRRYNVDGTPDLGYSDQGIRNTLSDLVNFGYLVSARMAAEKGGRAMAHYTIRKPRTEDLQDMITAWIMAQRSAPARPHPVAHARRSLPDVTSQPDVTSDVIRGDDVMPAHDIMSTSSGLKPPNTTIRPADVISRPDVTSGPDVTSDVISPVAPVTNTKKLIGGDSSADVRTREAQPAPSPNPGEEAVGHGVFVNGDTVRHAAFAISLPGIRMNTINSGLSANETRERCVAHALQWAAEIENGARPDKVLPNKIANFLARSIMGEVNQNAVQSVRVAKAREGYQRPGSAPNADGKVETTSERWARITAEQERNKSMGARR